MDRLDKAVATCGGIPRSEAGGLIRRGQVTVDGTVCRDPGRKLDPAVHTLAIGQRVLCSAAHLYIMLNKPQGILCVSRDPKAETVVDLLPREWRRRGMFPAGRLDKDTVGLVLLTDDGDWAHRVTAPRKAVIKHYRAVVEGRVGDDAVAAFAAGIPLDEETVCLPAEIAALSADRFFDAPGGDKTALLNDFSAKYRIPLPPEFTLVDIAIQEGRYHQIKRMCEAVGHKVLWLKRVSIGGLSLDGTLQEGESRLLSPAERESALFR